MVQIGKAPTRRVVTGFLGVALAMAAQTLAMAQAPAANGASGNGVPVTVAAAVRQDIPVLLRNIGTVQANQSALIRARVDGTIDQVFFDEGQEVKKGDKLVQLDPRPYQAALDAAKAKKAQDTAQLASAKADLARYSDLARSQFASRQSVDQQAATVNGLLAQLQADDANIAAAQVNLDYTTITAPYDGRMGLRQIDPGNVVRAADTTGVGIVTIAQVHPITITFNLPQDTLPAIRAGMAAGKLTTFAYSSDDRTLLDTGELLTPDNTVDTTTGTIKLKARFPNVRSQLWPGQFVNVRLQTAVQKGVVTVPSIAVQRGPGGALFVYLAKPDNTAAVTPVKMGLDDGTTAVITEGLDAGALVVVNGQSRLQNGTRIAATQAKPAS